MKFVVKLSPEITIKSRSVRLRFIRILTWNIRNILKKYDKTIVVHHWDYIEVYAKNEDNLDMILNLLIRIPGIHHILKVEDVQFSSLKEILEQVLVHYSDQIIDRTFRVRVKRHGKHTFTSVEAEKYIGNGLNKHIKSSHVKLINPEVIINLEIKNDRLFLIKCRYEGSGGFPVGTQGNVLSLISGGFDSCVSSYMLIRRGCRVHYCFFSFGNKTHENSVHKIAYNLWNRFSNSHRVRFIVINFRPIFNEIIEKVSNSQMSIVLKRMMIRAASMITERFDIKALATGEVIGQVSSQTLSNLLLIDSVSNTLILRPLISYDKESIIHLTNKLGISDIINTVPEHCSMFSIKPTVKSTKNKIEMEENNFNFNILDKAVEEIDNMDIREFIHQTKQELFEIEIVNSFSNHDIILDIRALNENGRLLKITGAKVLSLPFYKLRTKFKELDQRKTYLLWCESGIMSRLLALNLREQGFINVKVYRPVRNNSS